MEIFGDLDQYDHVAFIIPPHSGDWSAYAYFNDYDSYYHDEIGTYVSFLMHEIGHNLNLDHSGEDNDCYDDQSGYMGYSYYYSNWPQMCYNAPKYVQLGWVADHEVSLSSSSFNWSGDLYPIADYSSTSS